MMQLASDQGISAYEGMGTVTGTLTNEENKAANDEGTAANDHAPADEGAPTDETPHQSCEAEARHVALPQTDTPQTDGEAATSVTRAVP